MKFFAPPVSQKDLRQPVGAFTASSFVPMLGRAVTGTSDGDVVLWEGTPVRQCVCDSVCVSVCVTVSVEVFLSRW